MTASLGLLPEPPAPVEVSIDIVVRGIPVPKGSMRGFVNPKTERVVVTADNPQNLKAWTLRIAEEAERAMAGHPIFRGAVRVQARFVFPRPSGHFGKKGQLPSAPAHKTTKPDVDKLERAFFDALKGTVWVDDALVIDSHVAKSWGDEPGLRARVTLLV